MVDIRLPDGSGYEVISALRAQPGGERPAALILSMLGGFLDKVEAIHCGADGYFEKPPDWEALKRRLQHLLEAGKRFVPAVVLKMGFGLRQQRQNVSIFHVRMSPKG